MRISIKAAAWIAVGLLWLGQLAEAVTDPSMLPVPVDHWGDRATIVVTMTMAVHAIARRYGHVAGIEARLDACDAQAGAMLAMMQGTVQLAGVDAPDLTETAELPPLRVVGD